MKSYKMDYFYPFFLWFMVVDELIYAPFYSNYIQLAGNPTEFLTKLNEVSKEQIKIITEWPDERLDFSYASGKWTVKELLYHILDCERIMVYRALRFSKGDIQELLGFDEDFYVKATPLAGLTKADLLAEFEVVRKSSILLFKRMSSVQMNRVGKANDSAVSVSALLAVIIGHSMHHFKVLQERYR